jgi:hypothetical protein
MPFPRHKPFDDCSTIFEPVEEDGLPELVGNSPAHLPALVSNASSHLSDSTRLPQQFSNYGDQHISSREAFQYSRGNPTSQPSSPLFSRSITNAEYDIEGPGQAAIVGSEGNGLSVFESIRPNEDAELREVMQRSLEDTLVELPKPPSLKLDAPKLRNSM